MKNSVCVWSLQTCHQKLSVLSIEDMQIIKLSARSPYNVWSGCRIVPKGETATTPSSVRPTDSTDSNTSADGTVLTEFDRFLETTTVQSMQSDTSEIEDFNSAMNSTGFNETDVFNVSNAMGGGKSHNGGGLQFKHDIMPFENELENTTAFRVDVEEMFQKLDSRRPIREIEPLSSRPEQLTPLLRRSTREKLLVHCHSAGTFLSARERWWYIAVSNCGSDKGLDLTYRFKMTNGQPGDFWSEHYSADEMRMSSTRK